MSVQVAMMAGMAAMTAYSSIKQGEAQADALGGQAMGQRVQGAQYQVEAAQSQIQSQQEELHRRAGLMRLLQANRADLAGRGVSGDQGSSFDVIQDYNESEAAKDIANIRFMGEARTKRLSFAKDSTDINASNYLNMAGMARTQGILGAVRAIGGAAYSAFGGAGAGTAAGIGGLNGGWGYAGAGMNNGVMNGP